VAALPGSGKLPEVEESALQSAHVAFHSIARQRFKRLQAAGLEPAAASSQLLDDLVIDPHHLNRLPVAEQPSSSGSLSSSSPSVQHVVACTGASVAHATKILLLKEEISRLRREGHSTVSLIERLKERLHVAGEIRESADENGGGVFGAWQNVGGAGAGANSSKKRRVAGGSDVTAATVSPFETRQQQTPPPPTHAAPGFLIGPEYGGPRSEPSRLHDFGYPAGLLGAVTSPRSCPADAKRKSDDGVSSLQQLKKLKLRPPATTSPHTDS